MDFPTEMLNILVCPIDKSQLEYKESKLICKKCHKVYPIVDGIADMTI